VRIDVVCGGPTASKRRWGAGVAVTGGGPMWRWCKQAKSGLCNDGAWAD